MNLEQFSDHAHPFRLTFMSQSKPPQWDGISWNMTSNVLSSIISIWGLAMTCFSLLIRSRSGSSQPKTILSGFHQTSVSVRTAKYLYIFFNNIIYRSCFIPAAKNNSECLFWKIISKYHHFNEYLQERFHQNNSVH